MKFCTLSGSQVLRTWTELRNLSHLPNNKQNMRHAAKFTGANWQGLLSAERPLQGNFWDFAEEGQFFAFTSNPMVSKNLGTSLASTQKYHCMWMWIIFFFFFFFFGSTTKIKQNSLSTAHLEINILSWNESFTFRATLAW